MDNDFIDKSYSRSYTNKNGSLKFFTPHNQLDSNKNISNFNILKNQILSQNWHYDKQKKDKNGNPIKIGSYKILINGEFIYECPARYVFEQRINSINDKNIDCCLKEKFFYTIGLVDQQIYYFYSIENYKNGIKSCKKGYSIRDELSIHDQLSSQKINNELDNIVEKLEFAKKNNARQAELAKKLMAENRKRKIENSKKLNKNNEFIEEKNKELTDCFVNEIEIDWDATDDPPIQKKEDNIKN